MPKELVPLITTVSLGAALTMVLATSDEFDGIALCSIFLVYIFVLMVSVSALDRQVNFAVMVNLGVERERACAQELASLPVFAT